MSMKRFFAAAAFSAALVLSAAEAPQSPFQGRELDAAIWQYCAELPVANRETGGPVRAFLWVPPSAEKIRGVVVGQFNMVERPILESEELREHLSRIGWGCVWIDNGMFGGHFDHAKDENSAKMQSVFDSLAERTGLDCFREIPFIGIGHSAMADFGYELAAWRPDRAVGAISYDGNTLCVGKNNQMYDHPFVTPDDLAKMKGIPLLHRDSEGNSGKDNNKRTPLFRTRYPDVPFTILADPSSTHFGFPHSTCDFLGAWIEEADRLRNPNGKLPLIPIDPKNGWFVDFWRYDAEPLAKSAPFADYSRNDGNWVFNQRIAELMQAHDTAHNNKKHCVAAFVQDGEIVPDKGGHVGFSLKFNPLNDGLRFPLSACFRKTATDNRQSAWAGAKPGDPLEAPETENEIEIRRICGPVEILGDGFAAVRFDRYGINKSGRANTIYVLLTYPGNKTFRASEIPAELRIPLRNSEGAPQTIDFPALPDVPAGTKTLKLEAKSSLGLPVEYYVEYGPAYLKDGVLHFTELPQCTTGPIEVKVVAWQYGRAGEPKVQSAAPVARTFRILR